MTPDEQTRILALEAENERLKAELSKTKKSEKHLLDALRLSPMALCHHDRDLRYVWLFNPHMGFVVEEVIGKTDWDILDKDLADRMGAIKRRVLETGIGERVEMPSIEGDENSEYFDLVVEPLRDEQSGEVIGLSCSGIDVTEDRRLREKYRLSEQQAATANRAKTNFLAAASHDLRQPLQTIALYAGTLEGLIADPKASQALGKMQQSIDTMNGLLSNLLDISKIDAGIVETVAKSISVADLWERLEGSFSTLAQSKELDLRFVPSSAHLWAPPIAVERILNNLLSNALAYTETGRVLVGCRRRPDGIEIQVWDTGAGIDISHQEEIFQEFFQLNNPERNRTKGVGLGLAISDRLAKLIETEIKISSIRGKGSVFSFLLKRGTKNAASEQHNTPAPNSVEDGLTVLVIEDVREVLEAMECVLQTWGCRSLLAETQEEAEALLAEGAPEPDLILADFSLREGKTGLAAIRALRERLGRDVPAAIVSGDTSPARLKEVQREGLEMLTKPISMDALKSAIFRLT